MIKRLSFVVLILALLSVGSLIILKRDLVLEYWSKLMGEEDTRIVVAKVQSLTGDPKYRLPRKLVYRDLKEGGKLRYFDTISTDEDSSLVLSFNSGLVLELGPNSILVLEKPEEGQAGDVVISFLQGNFNVLKEGRSGQVLLNKKEDTIDPSGRSNEALVIEKQEVLVEDVPTPSPTPIATPLPQIVKPSPTPTPIKRRKESLPDDYIASVIKKQRPFLNRCYAQHLRLNPNASGRMSLNFTIQPTGEVKNAKVLKSTLSDPRLQECTLNVIERVKFRNFDGDPVVVNYPINYE